MFKITNGNKTDFIGRHNGIDYAFPAGKPVYCEDEPAMHIFGIGQKDKTPIIARHGWGTLTGGLAQGMEVLNAFQFEHMSQNLDAPLARIVHGPAPVVQDAPDDEGGTDGSLNAPGAVEKMKGSASRGPGRPPMNQVAQAA